MLMKVKDMMVEQMRQQRMKEDLEAAK